MWQEERDLDAIIGDDCSVVCQPVALLAAAWNIPEVAYSCVSNALSDKKTYPTFSRSSNVYNNAVPILIHIAEVFNWNRLAIITDLRDLFRSVAIETKNGLESRGVQVTYHAMSSSMNSNDVIPEKVELLRQLLNKLKEQVRIFLIMMYTPDIRNILVLGQKLGMLDGRYAFFGLDAGLDTRMLYGLNPELGLDVWQGWIRPLSIITLTEEETFKQNLQDQIMHPEFHPAVIPSRTDLDAQAPKAGRVHDAVLMWAHGVNKTLDKGGRADDGLQVSSNIFNSSFRGVTGDIHIDNAGNRLANFKVEIFQDGRFVRLMEWNAATQTMDKVYKPNDSSDWSGLLWAGNSTLPPSDTPPCGWQQELCVENDSGSTIQISVITSVTMAVLCLVAIASFLRARNQMKIKLAKSAIIPWDSIATDLRKSSTVSRSRATVSSSKKGDGTQLHGQVTSKWNNQIVAVSALGKGQINIADHHLRQSLVAMKSLKHENIRCFFGLTVDEEEIVHVISDLAPRGSVHDVIASAMKLTWDLKVSLIRDISAGMHFLHGSEVGFHGCLSSASCVIDNRWTCKIDGHGLGYLKSQLANQNGQALDLWKAPEILRNKDYPTSTALVKHCDIYAFGIIISEILNQDIPFGNDDDAEYDAEEILERVKAGETPPFRPIVLEDECPKDWLRLMERCWAEDPENRIQFREIVRTINTLTGGNKSLVDNMVSRLEAHTQNLEGIVFERTAELFEEKGKMESLLLELLPKTVAVSLTRGQQVSPETFEDVTIFFSDVVGFTRISAAATPMEVVNMLNGMYTLLDEASAKYDVYKVATIGDAYFVASGVPVRNGDKHAAEVSRMALDLLAGLDGFVIGHMTNETLKLRIGIHTGPVVAGITGLKMPRYLLFGDTVDIASKMESGGESMRIQISQFTAAKLHNCQDLRIVFRGETRIKGVGDISTYWLEKALSY